ncbi:MAG: VWA-like domain-containing protein [Pseudomonadota bacterium]
MAETHSRRASRALQALAETDPAIGALALWCAHTDGPGSTRTEGGTIVYGEGFEALSLPEQMGLAAHHVLHIAFRHGARANAMAARYPEDFDRRLFNISADALTNAALLSAGFALPRPALTVDLLPLDASDTRSALAELDAETLYTRLLPRQGTGAASERQTDDRGTRAEASHRAAEKVGFEEDFDDTGAQGDAEDAAAWEDRVAQALLRGKLAGRGLGSLGFRLADLPRARIPWETTLRTLIMRSLRHDPEPTHSRPARRWIAAEARARTQNGPSPAFEPGRRRYRDAPRLAVCLDASSSVTEAHLARFATEVAGIGRRSGAEVHVIVFDEAVRSWHRMQGLSWEAEILRQEFSRDGGTDFRPAIAAAAALDPSAIIVMTDLDGSFGEAPGRLPVIWAATTSAAAKPPFGKVIDLTD